MKRIWGLVLGVLLLASSPAFALNDHSEKTLQSAAVAVADGSAISVEGYSTVGLELTLAGTATVTFEGSISGVSFTAIPCISAGSVTAVSTTATASGLWQCQVAGLTAVRARISAWTSGAVTVFARATTGRGIANVGQYDASGNLTVAKAYQDGGEHIGEGQVEDLGYQRTVGGKARSYSLMTDVTTNTSSSPTTLPAGSKTFFAKIVGSAGAQSVTVNVYGDYKSTATETFPLCTIALSGTSEDADKCSVISEDYDNYHAKTTSISGTNATVNVWAMMGNGGAGGGAVTNAGTFVTQVDGAALTSLQLIDDDQTGTSNNYKTSAGTTEDETEIKATAGRLMGIQITNTNAAARYFRCSNLTAANTTPGTSTVFYGIAVPGATVGDGLVMNFGPSGIAFSTALTCWVVTGVADTDVAEVAANEIKWNIQYK